MTSKDGRYVLVFNGEIYNFKALRRELESLGHHWRGHSDTEVMLAAFTQWGFEPAIKRSNGMFALALWDKGERTLHLTRDRIGEKPLYYGFSGNTFLFGSELKALRAHPDFKAEINRDALALFLRYNYIPAPYSIYQGIYKLTPGTYLLLDERESSLGQLPQPLPYWSAREAAESGTASPFEGTEAEAVTELEAMLTDAVGLRMVADVPLGAFLSGGVDSSTVVALITRRVCCIACDRRKRSITLANLKQHRRRRAIIRHVAANVHYRCAKCVVSGILNVTRII